MIPEFARQIEALARRLRRRLILRAISWIVVVIVAVSYALGGLDYLLHFQERGLRLLATSTLVATSLWCFFRIAQPVLAISIDKVALARWLERFQRGSPISLAAACDLISLPQDDLRWGSVELRQMAIEQAETHWKTPPWQELQTQTISLWPGYLAVSLLLIILTFVFLNPVVAGTAIIRLLNPWSNLSYPQNTHLVVIHYPARLSRGDTFVLRVGEEADQLPPEVRVLIRQLDEEVYPIANQPMKRVRNQFVFRQENVRSSFEFQIVGGDDRSQPWRHVEVVDPPLVRSLQVRLIPPSYTGWTAEDAQGLIRALCGTEVRVTGRADRALKRVIIDRGAEGAVDAEVLPDQHSFRFPQAARNKPEQALWIIQRSGSYRIRLEALDGTFSVNEPRWEIRAIEDAPPIVVVESHQRLLQMTPEGKFPLQITARDDLSLKRVAVICTDDQDDLLAEPISVYEGAQFPRVRIRMSELEPHTDSIQNAYMFQLPGAARRVGLSLRIRAIAEDYKGQIAESQPLEIRIVSHEELSDRLTTDQERLLGHLGQLYESFCNIRREWDQLCESLRTDRRLSRTQANQLLTLDTMQRQLFRQVADPTGGILHDLHDLADTGENNGINQQKVERLKHLHDALETAWKEHGIPAESHLGLIANWARTLAERTTSDDQLINIEKEWNDVAQNAEALSSHQAAWETFLETLLRDVTGLRLANHLRRELERVLGQQIEVTRHSRELGPQTLGRDLQDLTPPTLNQLRQISRSQLNLATAIEELVGQTLEKLEQRERPTNLEALPEQIQPTPHSSGDKSPTSGSADLNRGQPSPQSFVKERKALSQKEVDDIKLVIQRINSEGLSALMRQASFAIEENRLSEALTLQERCETILRELINLLQGKNTYAQRQDQVLAQFEKELQTLIQNQEKLVHDFAKRYQDGNTEEAFSSFIQEQSRVKEKMEKLLQDVSSLPQGNWRSYLEQAVQAMQAAQAGAAHKAVGETSQNAELAQYMMQQALDQVRSEHLADRRLRTLERLQGVLVQIKELIGIQQDLLRRTQSLDIERRKSPLMATSQSWKTSVLGLRQGQDALGKRITRMINDWQDAPVISAILGRIQKSSDEAARHLATFECGKVTQDAQQAVLRDLQLVATAFQSEAPSSRPLYGDQIKEEGTSSEQSPQLPGQIFLAAQVKLLRELQESINRRTENLEQSRTQVGDTQALLEEKYRELTEDQALVVNLVAKLSEHIAQGTSGEKVLPPQLLSPPQEGTSPSGELKPPISPRPSQPGSLEDLFAPQ
ncbi:MAG: hypothetical protein ACUVQH_06260 [Thermogutta sp.]